MEREYWMTSYNNLDCDSKLRRSVKAACASVLVAGISLMLHGCGVSIETKRIALNADTGKIPLVIPGQGITTALVRTRFDLLQPMSWTAASTTTVGDSFDACLHACIQTDGSDQNSQDACTVKQPEPNLSYSKPSIRPVTVPDHSRLYQAIISADLLQTSNITVQGAANGTLQDVDAETSSVAFEVLAAAFKAATAAAAARTRLDVPTVEASTPYKGDFKELLDPDRKAASKPSCFVRAGEMRTFKPDGKKQLTCEQVKAVQACIIHDTGTTVEKERQARDRLFDQAVERKLDHQLLAAAAANRAERIASVEARLNAVRSYYGVSSKRAQPVLFTMVKVLNGPEEFMPYADTAHFGDLTNKTTNPWAIESQQDLSGLDIEAVAKKLEVSGRNYSVKAQPPSAFAPAVLASAPDLSCSKIERTGSKLDKNESEDMAKTDAAAAMKCDEQRRLGQRQLDLARAALDAEETKLGSGFRYRIPVTTVTTVDVTQVTASADPKAPPEVAVLDSIKAEGIIAQYGPIAAMPSHFKGKGGKVHLKFWPDSGGIQTAEIGSDGVDASTITSVMDKFETEYKERRKRADEAAFRAGGADPEIEALRREKEKLELRKEIFELRSRISQ